MNKLLNKFGLVLLAVLSTFLVWLPFHLKLNNFWGLDFSEGAFVLWKNFDGPNYLIIAKTWYDKVLIAKQFSNPLPVEYYPAHWPLYPAIIFVFNLLFDGPWAMLMAGVAGVGLFYWVLPKFLLKFGVKKENIFWLGIVSLVLPARWCLSFCKFWWQTTNRHNFYVNKRTGYGFRKSGNRRKRKIRIRIINFLFIIKI